MRNPDGTDKSAKEALSIYETRDGRHPWKTLSDAPLLRDERKRSMITALSAGLAGAACLLLPPVLTQPETVLAFAVFFMTAWVVLATLEDAIERLNAKREQLRIRKGNRRNLTVNVRLNDHNTTLYIERSRRGTFARWL